MKYKILLLSSFLVLNACSNAKNSNETSAQSVAADATMAVEKIASAPPPPPPPPAPMVSGNVNNNEAANIEIEKTIIKPMLAYSYAITMLLPQDKVEGQMRKHAQECEKAGLNLCQIVNSSINNDEFNKSASLSIRGEPKWLMGFRNGLEQSTKDNGGKITASNVNSEDLTREITDTEARLRALNSLQKRLEVIIASRPAKLTDLLEAERELARVQGEIDSFNSNLKVAKSRVDMSVLNLNYQSRPNAVNDGIFSQTLNALSDFFRIMFDSLAFLIRAFAAILPFAAIGTPMIYFIIKFLKTRKKTEKNN